MIGWRGRLALLRRGLCRRLPPRMPRGSQAARGNGVRQRARDDPVLPHPEEADRVLEVMKGEGARARLDGLEVYVMCEVPSKRDPRRGIRASVSTGFSIGSNDLTQLTLGIDRDSDRLAGLFDERHPAVVWMIESIIERATRPAPRSGSAARRPRTTPEFARVLVEAGIDSISVTPTAFSP